MADDTSVPLFKVIETDNMTGWDRYLSNMAASPWSVTFTREEAEACVKWREANISRRYRYDIVPVQPHMTSNDAARKRHGERHGRRGMGDCSDIDCREASMRLAREELNRQFAERDAKAGATDG